MNTLQQAREAVITAIHTLLGQGIPAFDDSTLVGSFNIPADDVADFAQMVSDQLALLPNSEAEVACIVHVETCRRAADARAMTLGELVSRVARLPDFES